MKKFIIFLILIALTTCGLDEKAKEESKRMRQAYKEFMTDCILRNEKTSETLRNSIKYNLNDDIDKYFQPMGKKLSKNDKEIIRNCQREMIQFKNEERKKERENILKGQLRKNNEEL